MFTTCLQHPSAQLSIYRRAPPPNHCGLASKLDIIQKMQYDELLQVCVSAGKSQACEGKST